jgi:DNA repair protein RadD
MIQLRPYQSAAVRAVYDYFERRPEGNPLIVMPTGSGKAVVQAALLHDALTRYPRERFLLVSHVRELLVQNAEKLREVWPEAPIGIYSAGLQSRESTSAITIAGVQSAYKQAAAFGDIGLVVVDECHLVPKRAGGMYRRLLDGLRQVNPRLRVIGMSATPYRLDSGLLHEGPGAVFTGIAYEARISDLLAVGHLCPLVSRLGTTRADLRQVHTRAGEYVANELERAMNTEALVAGAVDEFIQLCADRHKWLVFCSGVEHAQRVCAELQTRGVAAACVTGTVSNAARDATLADFRSGRLRALVNVNVLTTGFDAPDIDAIILLRPTLSPGLYVQMVGRGLRPHDSKTNTLVLDYAGNTLRHGPIDQLRVRCRANGGGVMSAPVKECPACHLVLAAGTATCRECGWRFEALHRPARHEVHAADLAVLGGEQNGHMQVLDVDRVSYARHRKPGKPDSLRVTYRCGLLQYREWVCPEHPGLAGHHGRRWLLTRAGRSITSVDEALARGAQFRVPRRITVDLSEFYPRVVAYHELRAAGGTHVHQL